MKPRFLLTCLFFIFCFSCNGIDPKGEKEVRAFIERWNSNHTQLKAAYLKQDYMDVVGYYGNERTKTQVQEDKQLLFQHFPDYTQHLLDDELTITKEANTYLVVFNKQVQYNGVKETYASYLSLVLKNGQYKILREGVAKDAKNQDSPIFPDNRETTLATPRNRQLFGDFNGDGLSDYAFVKGPELLGNTRENKRVTIDSLCKGSCTSVITFSAPDLKAITVTNAYQSQLENLKDLNSDGADEIGFWNIKPTTKSLYIFDATTGELLTPPVVINTAVHKNLDLIDVFKKTGPGKITVTSSKKRDGKWVLVSDVVEVE